jgi:DNA modification methylase
MIELNSVYKGDCNEFLPQIESNSVDLIVIESTLWWVD